MTIHAVRLCHHCAVELSEDEMAHYLVECHSCVLEEHDLAGLTRSDPHHPLLLGILRPAIEFAARRREPKRRAA